MNDGFYYRLVYFMYDENLGGSTHGDDEYRDMDRQTILAHARLLKEHGAQVTLLRKPVVPEPPWERVQI